MQRSFLKTQQSRKQKTKRKTQTQGGSPTYHLINATPSFLASISPPPLQRLRVTWGFCNRFYPRPRRSLSPPQIPSGAHLSFRERWLEVLDWWDFVPWDRDFVRWKKSCTNYLQGFIHGWCRIPSITKDSCLQVPKTKTRSDPNFPKNRPKKSHPHISSPFLSLVSLNTVPQSRHPSKNQPSTDYQTCGFDSTQPKWKNICSTNWIISPQI